MKFWIEFIQQYSLKKNEIDLESFKETQLGKALTSFSDEQDKRRYKT